MCGIAGRVTSGEPVARALLERMCDSIDHRGPDDRGVYVDGPVGLGMTRLAIVDLVHGQQPMTSEDGKVVLVFNGEVYNHRALRRELVARGHRFASASDAEVVVHLWEELGPRCVTRLRGMFAFAIWDEGRRELFLARDRIGKKPLFYCFRGRSLTFGSEPRAVLQDPDVPRDVDPVALDAFLVNQYVPHELCAFAALRKLPPASTLRWRPGEGEPEVRTYWRLEYGPKRDVRPEEAAEWLRHEILEATSLRLGADVPVGAFLSGGIDSAVVVAAMAMSSPQPVRTFSVRFADDGYDESRYARMVAERYGTDHHELEVGALGAGLLPRVAWHFGEPFADPAALATFQLAELTRRHVKVALNGDGGDESFAGYRRYRQLALTRMAHVAPRGARRGAALALGLVAGTTEGRAPLPRAARLASRLALAPSHRYADLIRAFTEADRQALYGPVLRDTLGCDPLAHVDRSWAARTGLHWAERAMATDLDTYLSDDLVAKVDVTSMAHGLEVRSPLLDHVLMERSARLVPSLKLHGREHKVLLKRAARPWLPAAVIDRPKHGFALPVARWLRQELRDVPETVLLDPTARARGLFDTAAVERTIRAHRQGSNRALQLWTMIALELWHRTCVDDAIAGPAHLPVLP